MGLTRCYKTEGFFTFVLKLSQCRHWCTVIISTGLDQKQQNISAHNSLFWSKVLQGHHALQNGDALWLANVCTSQPVRLVLPHV